MEPSEQARQNADQTMHAQAQRQARIRYALKRLRYGDAPLLKALRDEGPKGHWSIKNQFGRVGERSLGRLRKRGLIEPIVHKSGYCKYEISDLGLDVLKAVEEQGGVLI